MIKISGLNKYYSKGTFHALKNVNLEIHKGEMVSILGKSGSGKSTLMNIIGLLSGYDSGSYYLDGIDTSTLSNDIMADIRNQKIGFVFQSFNLIPYKTVLSNVMLPLLYAGYDRKETRDRAEVLLSRLGLQDKLGSLPSDMSGGQCQRVAIARALVTNPPLILADEPTGALDNATSNEILQIFKTINDYGVTVVYVTHDKHIASMADRQISVEDGVVSSDVALGLC